MLVPFYYGESMKKFLTIVAFAVLTISILFTNTYSVARDIPQTCAWNFTEVFVSVQGNPGNKYLAGTTIAKCSSGVTNGCETIEVEITAVDMATFRSYTNSINVSSLCGQNRTIFLPLEVPNNRTYSYSFKGVGISTGITYFSVTGFVTVQ